MFFFCIHEFVDNIYLSLKCCSYKRSLCYFNWQQTSQELLSYHESSSKLFRRKYNKTWRVILSKEVLEWYACGVMWFYSFNLISFHTEVVARFIVNLYLVRFVTWHTTFLVITKWYGLTKIRATQVLHGHMAHMVTKFISFLNVAQK